MAPPRAKPASCMPAASAAYAEFGPFVTGLVGPADEILGRTR